MKQGDGILDVLVDVVQKELPSVACLPKPTQPTTTMNKPPHTGTHACSTGARPSFASRWWASG